MKVVSFRSQIFLLTFFQNVVSGWMGFQTLLKIKNELGIIEFVSDILIFIRYQIMTLRSSSSSSLCSFTSDQLCDIEDVEEEEDFEYHTAPWDIFGVHDTDGQILAVKKGERLPVTTKYKRKHTSSTPVKFHVNTKLQVEIIPYEPKKKKTISCDIIPNHSPQASLTAGRSLQSGSKKKHVKSIPGCEIDGRSDNCVDGGHVQQDHDEGHREAGNSGGGRSGMSGSNSHVFQEEARDSGGHSEQLYCDDDGGVGEGAGGAGKITENRVNVGKRFKSQAEFLTELDKEFEKKVIDGIEAGLRLNVKEKLATNIQLIPKENNAIVNSVLQNIFDQYGPEKPDIKFCERLAELLKIKFPATYREQHVVNSPLGKFAIQKSKGEGGYRGLAKRIGENFYNRIVRPTIKRPVAGEAGNENPVKKKMKKKGYCLSGEKWNIDVGATKKEKEDALKEFKRFSDADTIEEKRDALKNAVVFVQKQFREMEPSQTVEDLSSFWEGGPMIMSDWFEWLVGGSRDGSLAVTASLQMIKVLNIVEKFIIDKRGEEFEMELKRVNEEVRAVNGDSTMYQVFLIRDLAKLFKNKSEKFVFIDGKDDKKSGPDEKYPHIYITKQNTFGEGDFEEKIVLNLRIGDKIIWKDISLPEALAGVIQIFFSFNMLYPVDLDDILQFTERIVCNFGSDDGARNPKNMVKKSFRDFQVRHESLKSQDILNLIFSGICC